MSVDNIKLLTYQEVLENIKNDENHLLLGNGFNRGLGVNTSYSSIFQKMIENDLGLYKEAESMVNESKNDLELFIKRLTKDIKTENTFLKKFVNNKVKIDFMKATHEIVKSELKNIYAEKNEGVFLLLNSFTNYFTLNYDPLLYLLLLKFKSNDKSNEVACAMQPTLNFIKEDLDAQKNNIYTEIKYAREHGLIKFTVTDENVEIKSELKKLKKSHFIALIEEYSNKNNKKWKKKDISLAVKSILEEEKENTILTKVDDGSRQLDLFGNESEFVFNINNTTQNLFFLHGAFHIYKDEKSIKKITQKTDKALYERIEGVLNSEEKELVCVFQADGKKEEIEKNEYLKNCLEKHLLNRSYRSLTTPTNSQILSTKHFILLIY